MTTKTTKKAVAVKKSVKKAVKQFHVPPMESKIHIVKKGENPFHGECRAAQFSKVRNGMTVEQFKASLEKAKLGFDNRLLAMAAAKGVIRLSA